MLPFFFNKGNSTAAASAAARSSSASHYSEDFGTIGAGTAAEEFYGVPLSNDLSDASVASNLGLCFLLVALLIKPRFAFLRKPVPSALFWIGSIAGCYWIRDATLVPLLTNVIYTRTTYPYLVVLPHSIVAAASCRRDRSSSSSSSSSQRQHYLSSFGMGFFLYGFGGSILSDVLMGLPVTALGHPRIVPCYVLGWLLVWWSPFDVTYRLLSDGPGSFVRHFLNACEAVDAVTTPMGRVSRSARELSNKTFAPICAGVFAGAGGAAIRHGERIVAHRGGDDGRASFAALESATWKSLWYSILWWYLAVRRCDDGSYDDDDLETNHCHEYNGHNLVRVVIVGLHVLWSLSCDSGLTTGHPFVWLSRQLRDVSAEVAFELQLGPDNKALREEKIEKKD